MKQIKIIILSIAFTAGVFHVSAQENFNATIISNLQFDVPASDIWGYVDDSGREYAIMGLDTATVIISLEDPANPVEIARVPGARSQWRDIKSYGNFLYVTADRGQDGLLVIDMSLAPDSISWEFWKPEFDTLGLNGTIQRCHNLYIDEAGYAYLSGCNINSGGVIILDVFTQPGRPELAGVCDPRYSHDNFSRGDTVWSADVFNGFFSVIDVSDKANPVTLATKNTSSNFTHNAWLSDDGKYLFTTDERANAWVDAYDVSDLDNIVELDRFRPKASEGSGVIPHNTHYYNGFLVTSWYSDGLVITDVHRPENMIQVAAYDTYPGAHGGFNGAWGAYPYLPSGLVLVSDIQTGLYVIQVDYQRASYLEGIITDASDGQPVIGANVIIESPFLNGVESSFIGAYKTGLATPGTYTVSVNHPYYDTAEAVVVLESGIVTIQDFQMQPKKRIVIGGTVKKEGPSGQNIEGAHVVAQGEELRFETITDAEGNFSFEVLEGLYDIYVGAWGYLHRSYEDQVLSADERRVFELPVGYQDDFFADLGWSVNSTAPRGIWELAVPVGTLLGTPLGTLFANPNRDVNGDIGDMCYVTGNGGRDAGFDDVDDGYTLLSSPPMDLREYERPNLRFAYWYFVGGGRSLPNDTFVVTATNGIGDTAVLLEVTEITFSGWFLSDTINLADYLQLTDNVQIHFLAQDDIDNGHIVEAGVDFFSVYEGMSTGVNKKTSLEASVYPNPFSDYITITVPEKIGARYNWAITHINGATVRTGTMDGSNTRVYSGDLATGMYLLTVAEDSGARHVEMLIKVE
jgi:choice-of-anchor B domain-containing protein